MEQTKVNLYYLGKTYPLYTKVDSAIKKTTIQMDGDIFICTSPKEGEVDVVKALKAFYVKAGRKVIEERLKFYQPQIRAKYKSFSIESHPSKWGSCNSDRHLTFHWKLIMFPIDVVDYVVVLELCHLIHMNHDRSFWRLVGRIYPKYKEAMAILGTEKTRDI